MRKRCGFENGPLCQWKERHERKLQYLVKAAIIPKEQTNVILERVLFFEDLMKHPTQRIKIKMSAGRVLDQRRAPDPGRHDGSCLLSDHNCRSSMPESESSWLPLHGCFDPRPEYRHCLCIRALSPAALRISGCPCLIS